MFVYLFVYLFICLTDCLSLSFFPSALLSLLFFLLEFGLLFGLLIVISISFRVYVCLFYTSVHCILMLFHVFLPESMLSRSMCVILFVYVTVSLYVCFCVSV